MPTQCRTFRTGGCRAADSAACGLAAACSKRCRACSAMYAPATSPRSHSIQAYYMPAYVCFPCTATHKLPVTDMACSIACGLLHNVAVHAVSLPKEGARAYGVAKDQQRRPARPQEGRAEERRLVRDLLLQRVQLRKPQQGRSAVAEVNAFAGAPVFLPVSKSYRPQPCTSSAGHLLLQQLPASPWKLRAACSGACARCSCMQRRPHAAAAGCASSTAGTVCSSRPRPGCPG